MRLLVVGALTACLAIVLVLAVLLVGYRQDQERIRWFPGTGIAGKVDALGPPPDHLLVQDGRTGAAATVAVLPDGAFVAPLAPGIYRLRLAGDPRSAVVDVPAGRCVDLVLDYRLPGIVLEIPGEGWPIPHRA